MSEESDKAIKALEETGGAINGVLPQVFFDLVGRMIPGTVILTGGLICVPEVRAQVMNNLERILELKSAMVTFATIIVAACACYLFAMFFYGCFLVLTDWRSKWLFRCFGIPLAPDLSESEPAKRSKDGEPEPTFSNKLDTIKLVAPGAGSRIVKIKAEIHCVSTLLPAGGFFALTTVFQCAAYRQWWLMVMSLLISVAAIGALRRLLSYLDNRWKCAIESYYNVIQVERGKKKWKVTRARSSR